MLSYFKMSSSNGNGKGQGPTMNSDIEDLIESQPADKTMHDWEQSTIEYYRPSNGRRSNNPRPYRGLIVGSYCIILDLIGAL